MGASINYRIIKPASSLGVYLPQNFIRICERVFGQLPKNFGTSDLERLRVIEAIEEDGNGDAWQKLIKLIETHGDIEVSASY